MLNHEVAQAIAQTALVYANAGDLETVKANLRYIAKVLENPTDENLDHDEDDFK